MGGGKIETFLYICRTFKEYKYLLICIYNSQKVNSSLVSMAGDEIIA